MNILKWIIIYGIVSCIASFFIKTEDDKIAPIDNPVVLIYGVVSCVLVPFLLLSDGEPKWLLGTVLVMIIISGMTFFIPFLFSLFFTLACPIILVINLIRKSLGKEAITVG